MDFEYLGSSIACTFAAMNIDLDSTLTNSVALDYSSTTSPANSNSDPS